MKGKGIGKRGGRRGKGTEGIMVEGSRISQAQCGRGGKGH